MRKALKGILIFFQFFKKLLILKYKNKKFIIEVQGLNKKLQKIKLFLDKLITNNKNLMGFFFLPRYSFFTQNRKKIKSIKKRLVKKQLNIFLKNIRQTKFK